MAQAMLRLLAIPKTTATRPCRLIIHTLREDKGTGYRRQEIGARLRSCHLRDSPTVDSCPRARHNSKTEVSMASDFDQTKRKLDEAASKIEQEIKGVVQHLNDHVVPKIRVEGTNALRNMAEELRKLADRMDDTKKSPEGR